MEIVVIRNSCFIIYIALYLFCIGMKKLNLFWIKESNNIYIYIYSITNKKSFQYYFKYINT